jgi:hypothetical protein
MISLGKVDRFLPFWAGCAGAFRENVHDAQNSAPEGGSSAKTQEETN